MAILTQGEKLGLKNFTWAVFIVLAALFLFMDIRTGNEILDLIVFRIGFKLLGVGMICFGLIMAQRLNETGDIQEAAVVAAKVKKTRRVVFLLLAAAAVLEFGPLLAMLVFGPPVDGSAVTVFQNICVIFMALGAVVFLIGLVVVIVNLVRKEIRRAMWLPLACYMAYRVLGACLGMWFQSYMLKLGGQ